MASFTDRSSPFPQEENIPSSPPPFPQLHVSRKRHLVEDDDLSSDPIFSEDVSEDDEPSGIRRKRRFRGPWWAHTSRRPHTRHGVKFADSGVWLASESSDEGGLLISQAYGRQEREASMSSLRLPVQMSEDPQSPQPEEVETTPSSEELAARIVLDCVETGTERIDLSDMSLNSLAPDTIRPLHQLIRNLDNPDSDTYAPLEPDLQLYLSKNNLKEVPAALWNLENITVLSLRNNHLHELPSAVRKLHKLKELNVAGNAIRWLPWELLDCIKGGLGHPLRLTLRPNPFWQPMECAPLSSQLSTTSPPMLQSPHFQSSQTAQNTTWDNVALGSHLRKIVQSRHKQSPENMGPIFAASSAVRYFEIDSKIHRDSIDLPSAHETSSWPAQLDFGPSPPHAPSAPPSLFEAAAKVVLKHLQQLGSLKDSPELIENVVQYCKELRNGDLPKCSVCSREYLYKRAEWVEYWHCNVSVAPEVPHFLFLPFMRQACSWGCAENAGRRE